MMAKRKVKADATYADWLGDGNGEVQRYELVQALDETYGEGPSELEVKGVKGRLKQALEEQLPPVIYYDLIEDRQLGAMWVAVSENKLIAISYDKGEEVFLRYLSKLSEGRPQRSSKEVRWAAKDVLAYLKRQRKDFDLEIDLSGITAFQRKVLAETSKIPRGQISTYAEIAKRIGKPKAVRAVGQALRRNPIPIVVPCHRVVASDGGLGGYSGRMWDARKVHLLKLEGVVFA